MMNNKFDRFENFGSIADEATRKKLAETIYQQLQGQSGKAFGLSNADTDNFATAIDEILSNPTMKELCSKDPELAEKITQEILDFVNKTKKQLNKTENPFENEIELKQEFEQSKKPEFKNKWKKVNPVIKNNYDKKEIDVTFYEKEFSKSLVEKNKSDKDKPSFESVKEHFNEKWDELLYKKQTKWELEQIEAERKKFCEELYKRIDELKKLQEALEPFTNELGRLWCMSKGNWQRVNFDILKKYAELLKKDRSLQELAEMLGKMRQAEKEYEEEQFANIRLKPEWKAEHASKEDLIGIQESDDLSSMLPSETAFLADETLQTVFLKKFAEKKLQTFEYQSKMLSYREEEFQDKRQKEKEEKNGPFIICVDTSGSMHGTPETVAKTLSLAILKIAIKDNRKCYLISYSDSFKTMELHNLNNSLNNLLDFLSMSFLGGNNEPLAMKEVLRILQTENYKKADVLWVSDFVTIPFDNLTLSEIEKAKQNKTKFHSLTIGQSGNPSIIGQFDNNWVYNMNDTNRVLSLVKNINEL